MVTSGPRSDGGLSIDIDATADHTIVLRGELDLATRDELIGAVNRLVEAGTRTVVFDVRELTFCDMSGFSVFATDHHLELEQCVLRDPSPMLRRIADLVRVETVVFEPAAPCS